MGKCKQCNNTTSQSTNKYCSNQCQNDFQFKLYIESWKNGHVSGGRGILAKNISGHVKRYLLQKYNHMCTVCGWNKINKTTGVTPLEIDHIDGNSENNRESNLRLLCPNCHSLTPSFRNLNKGNGREWRRVKYIKIK